ncbi:hypothetical protein [Aminobacter sp. MDW-2]|uniref:phage tail fiber protein n=1 Tax=Aminobacter sp. MDW-2 TaxID=2666139 RepID=UPI0012B125BA|nr:hypothetical protein [Aminobacter sp. MDW-2]MRX32808.1 hypothetical protein [Aminobacter sp. MDW-2]QNH34533.1 hypothetical protein H5P29_00835 [Aminobacter sp. MDW-2]
MPASTYLGNALINHILRGVAFATPARVYVSLHIGDPGLTGANEVGAVAWPAYARIDPALGAAIASGFDAAAAKVTANAKQMLWLAMDGPAPINVTHWAIWDADVGGNCLIGGPLKFPKTLEPTDECVIHIGELDVGVDAVA